MTEELFEPRPRFKGCPPICLHANLPAFKSAQEAAHFARNPSLIKWFCVECYHWHAWFKSPAPAGGSSGTSREERIPEHIARLAKGE
jgi:hypothetical protein